VFESHTFGKYRGTDINKREIILQKRSLHTIPQM
jgi:hypothetical protein